MRIAKVTEVIGSSEKSWEDAARVAVRRANRTLAGITGFEVLRKQMGFAEGGQPEYRVRLRLIFELAPEFVPHE